MVSVPLLVKAKMKPIWFPSKKSAVTSDLTMAGPSVNKFYPISDCEVITSEEKEPVRKERKGRKGASEERGQNPDEEGQVLNG